MNARSTLFIPAGAFAALSAQAVSAQDLDELTVGYVHLSVSQGVPPFVVAVSSGQNLQVVDVTISYSENDNCVFAADREMDKGSVSELSGKKVAVPLGTAAHCEFLRQVDHLRSRFNVVASG